MPGGVVHPAACWFGGVWIFRWVSPILGSSSGCSPVEGPPVSVVGFEVLCCSFDKKVEILFHFIKERYCFLCVGCTGDVAVV